MRISDFNIITEEDDAWRRGEEVDWDNFMTYVVTNSTIPGGDSDGILMLGIAGDPDAQGILNDLGKPVKISIGGSISAWFNDVRGMPEAGHFNPITGAISIGERNWDFNRILRHELRHRGFKIIRDIRELINRMPDDLREELKQGYSLADPEVWSKGGHVMNAEHKMIYAMEGKNVEGGRSYWQGRYYDCNREVVAWIREQRRSVPAGAPERVRQRLEKLYNAPVELVAPNQQPETTALPVEVPRAVANQARKPSEPELSARQQEMRELLISVMTKMSTRYNSDIRTQRLIWDSKYAEAAFRLHKELNVPMDALIIKELGRLHNLSR